MRIHCYRKKLTNFFNENLEIYSDVDESDEE